MVLTSSVKLKSKVTDIFSNQGSINKTTFLVHVTPFRMTKTNKTNERWF